MHPLVDPTERESVETAVLEDGAPTTMTTTLYDLLAAIQDAVGPDDDALAVATVWHVLQAGRVTWRGDVVTGVNGPPAGAVGVCGTRRVPPAVTTLQALLEERPPGEKKEPL